MTNILKKYNLDNKVPLVVGVSAGPDSMALLHMLMQVSSNIICAHINHNVRPESEEEEEFLQKYCHDNNIIFESYKIKNYHESNFENEARKIRYNFYEKILTKYDSNYLFLAHHGDDLIETVMMKIMRGSNLEGYAGIKEINKHGYYYIIRPLLNFTKEELINYNQRHNITYFIDNSNDDIKYTRNRYRQNILPILKDEDENVHQKFLKYSNTLLEYDNYIKEEANKIIKKVYQNNILNLTKFNTYHIFLRKNILYSILNNYYNNKPDIIKEKHILEIINMIDNQKPNLSVNLPEQKIAIKSYNELYFTSATKKQDYQIKFTDKILIDNLFIEKITKSTTDGNDVCRLNSQDIKLPLYFRNRKKGDIMKVKGLNGSKKIKDIFIDTKIPQEKRQNYPILVDANDTILWLPNLKKSQFNVSKEKKCDIILKCYQKEENND